MKRRIKQEIIGHFEEMQSGIARFIIDPGRYPTGNLDPQKARFIAGVGPFDYKKDYPLKSLWPCNSLGNEIQHAAKTMRGCGVYSEESLRIVYDECTKIALCNVLDAAERYLRWLRLVEHEAYLMMGEEGETL